MAYVGLNVTQIQPMPRMTGTEIHLSIPEHAAPVRFDLSHATVTTRKLIVWLRDPRKIAYPGETPVIELFGVFEGALTDPLRAREETRIQLETWFDEFTLADILEGSEFLRKRGLHYTVEGKMGTVLPG